MTFPFIPASLLVVGVGSAGYLVWDVVRPIINKKKIKGSESEVKKILEECGEYVWNYNEDSDETGVDYRRNSKSKTYNEWTLCLLLGLKSYKGEDYLLKYDKYSHRYKNSEFVLGTNTKPIPDSQKEEISSNQQRCGEYVWNRENSNVDKKNSKQNGFYYWSLCWLDILSDYNKANFKS